MDISVAETIFITSLLIIYIVVTCYYTLSFLHYEKLVRDVNIYRIRTSLIKTIYSMMINMVEGGSTKEMAYLFFDDNVLIQTNENGLVILYRSKRVEVRREELLEIANKIFSQTITQISFEGQTNSIVIAVEIEKKQFGGVTELTLRIR